MLTRKQFEGMASDLKIQASLSHYHKMLSVMELCFFYGSGFEQIMAHLIVCNGTPTCQSHLHFEGCS